MEFINKIIALFSNGWVQVIAAFIYMSVEFWLGRTDVVKPGSVLAVILAGIVKVLEFLKIKKPEA
jgi:hypothetical protein